MVDSLKSARYSASSGIVENISVILQWVNGDSASSGIVENISVILQWVNGGVANISHLADLNQEA